MEARDRPIDLGRLAADGGAELRVVLRWLRRQRGLSQRALTVPLNLAAHSAIVDYESGRCIPSPNILAAYERFFGLPDGCLRALRERLIVDRAAAEAQRELGGFPGTPATANPATPSPATAPRPGGRPPAQLPLDIADFTGREAELRRAAQAVPDDRAAVLTVSGCPGVGKTVLAIRLARLLASRFPDGQLFADLYPGGRRPLAPGTVLGRFLNVLGVAAGELPSSLIERGCLFRSLVAGTRVLILLDNVTSEAQVRPLLPGTPGCTVIITSRSTLSGLEGARSLILDLPPTEEALELFGRVAGDRRRDAEEAASRQVVGLCGRLPLAIRIAGARLASRPGWPVAELVRRLTSEQRRLTELTAGDCEIRSVFESSYLALDLQARQVFRLLGCIGSASFRIEQAAAVTGFPVEDIQPVVERLADRSLVQPAAPGCYRMHDLLRLYAAERSRDDDAALSREPAAIRAV